VYKCVLILLASVIVFVLHSLIMKKVGTR